MKNHIHQIIRLLDAQILLLDKGRKLQFSNKSWQYKNKHHELIDSKYQSYEKKIHNLNPKVTENEFNTYLSDRMCCSYEDFNQANT